MDSTTNYGFSKPTLTDNALITVLSQNFESIDNTIKSVETKNLVQTAGGTTGTAITLTLPSTLENGYKVTFVASANNGGLATTINGKPLYKPGTTTSPTLVFKKAYDIWYNSSSNCFFLKANASGNAVASDVLASKTFSTDIDTDIVGTIPTKSSATYSPSITTQTIASGQYLSGVQTIAPVTGTANTAQVLSSYTFSSANGINLTGTIPSKGATTYTPSTSNQTIPSGQYLNGNQTILGDSDLISSNIVSTANIFGVQGTVTGGSLLKYATGTMVAGGTANVGFTIVALYANAYGDLKPSGTSSDSANYLSNYWSYDVRFSGTVVESTMGFGSYVSSASHPDYVGNYQAHAYVKISGTSGIINSDTSHSYTFWVLGY